MDSGEWRYGQTESTQPWTSRAASDGDGEGDDDGDGEQESSTNLWTEDPGNAWGASWVPHQRSGEPGNGAKESVVLEPDAWYHPPVPAEWGHPWQEATGGLVDTPSATHPQSPLPTVAVAPMAPAQPAVPPAPPPLAPRHLGADGGQLQTSVDRWSAARTQVRRFGSHDDGFAPARSRREEYAEDIAYGPVLSFTAGWYGIPALLYLVWLVTLDGDRQGFVGRQFGASLPWLVAAVGLSLGIAGLLRWSTVGWRTLTLSFAATVIGAAVATIAHSLTI